MSQDTPENPAPSSNRFRWLVVLFILACFAAAGLWFVRDPAVQEQATEQAEGVRQALSESASSTPPTTPPVAKQPQTEPSQTIEQTTPQPEAEPQNVTAEQNPAFDNTSEQALATSDAESTQEITEPLQETAIEETTTAEQVAGQTAPEQAVATTPPTDGASQRGRMGQHEPPAETEGRQDDTVVKVAFIEDLALWLVEGYVPASNNSEATLLRTVQSANQRYGIDMHGLAWIGEDLAQGRANTIRYIYTEGMLNALYTLYVPRFMEYMQAALDHYSPNGVMLTTAQKRQFYKSYATYFLGFSTLLHTLGNLEDFPKQMNSLKDASQGAINANRLYMDRLFALDKAREEENEDEIERLTEPVDAAAKLYRDAIIAREKSRDRFIESVRVSPATSLLDAETIFFVASWLDRRYQNTSPETAKKATLEAATVIANLAARFNHAME